MSVSRLKTRGQVPPPVHFHSCEYLPSENSMFLLGGKDKSNTTTAHGGVIDMGKFIWSTLGFSKQIRVTGHQCCYYEGNYYVFGGDVNNEKPGLYRMKRDGNSTLMKVQRYPFTGTYPKSRADFSMNVVKGKSQQYLVIYGGRDLNNEKQLFNDLWVFGLKSKKWEKIGEYETRARHVSVYDERRMKILIFGGYDDSSSELCKCDNMFEIDVKKRFKFRKISPKGDRRPSARDFTACCIVKDCMILFGGNSTSGPVSDLYALELESMTWFILSKKLGPERYGHRVFFNGDFLFSFGGKTKSGNVSGDFLKIKALTLMGKFVKRPPKESYKPPRMFDNKKSTAPTPKSRPKMAMKKAKAVAKLKGKTTPKKPTSMPAHKIGSKENEYIKPGIVVEKFTKTNTKSGSISPRVVTPVVTTKPRRPSRPGRGGRVGNGAKEDPGQRKKEVGSYKTKPKYATMRKPQSYSQVETTPNRSVPKDDSRMERKKRREQRRNNLKMNSEPKTTSPNGVADVISPNTADSPVRTPEMTAEERRKIREKKRKERLEKRRLEAEKLKKQEQEKNDRKQAELKGTTAVSTKPDVKPQPPVRNIIPKPVETQPPVKDIKPKPKVKPKPVQVKVEVKPQPMVEKARVETPVVGKPPKVKTSPKTKPKRPVKKSVTPKRSITPKKSLIPFKEMIASSNSVRRLYKIGGAKSSFVSFMKNREKSRDEDTFSYFGGGKGLKRPSCYMKYVEKRGNDSSGGGSDKVEIVKTRGVTFGKQREKKNLVRQAHRKSKHYNLSVMLIGGKKEGDEQNGGQLEKGQSAFVHFANTFVTKMESLEARNSLSMNISASFRSERTILPDRYLYYQKISNDRNHDWKKFLNIDKSLEITVEKVIGKRRGKKNYPKPKPRSKSKSKQKKKNYPKPKKKNTPSKKPKKKPFGKKRGKKNKDVVGKRLKAAKKNKAVGEKLTLDARPKRAQKRKRARKKIIIPPTGSENTGFI